MNLSDAVYATSTMDLRLRYFSQSARVPLHPIQYSLIGTVEVNHGGRTHIHTVYNEIYTSMQTVYCTVPNV